MKLAEGKPLPRRLMAAMAQQDCGQCGYNCKDYADALFAKSEKRLNLCVPGGKETSRMLKQLYQELDGAAVPRRRRRRAAASAARRRSPRPAARATIRPMPRSCRAAASTSPARKRKPGTSTSISPAPVSIMWSAIRSAFSRPTIADSRRCGARRARCAAGLSDRRPHLARRTHRRRVAVAGARHAVRADFLSHRRRAQAEGQASCGRRGSRWRRRDARRAGGPAKVSRHPARSRGVHRMRSSRCSRGSIRSRRRIEMPIRAAFR